MNSAISAAITNRAIKNIITELEFLAESNLLATEQLQKILSLLPEPSESKSNLNLDPTPPSQVTNDSFVRPSLPTRKNASNVTIKPSPTPTPVPVEPSAPPPSYDSSEVLLEALYDYSGTQADDLHFKAGDKVVLKQKLNNDWWSGKNTRTNEEGLFPAQYVKVSIDGKKQSASDDNMMVNVAHEGRFGSGASQNGGGDPELKNKVAEHGKKFGSKLGNAAIFGAGATIGSSIVHGIF